VLSRKKTRAKAELGTSYSVSFFHLITYRMTTVIANVKICFCLLKYTPTFALSYN